MAISVLWHDDETICMVFEASWVWDDFDEAAQQTAALIEQHTHTVNLLLDLRAIRDFPTEGLGYHLPRMMAFLPENHGELIILGASEVIRTTFTIFSRAMQLPSITFTDTLPGSQGPTNSLLGRTG